MSHADIEAIYVLSPMQEGMLYHTVADARPGMYVGQLCLEMRGPVDPEAFRRSWQWVVDREPALRTGFVWRRRARALQVVRRRVPLTCYTDDWRGLAAGEQEARLDEFLRADRERGFDPGRPPLMRLALLRTGEARHQMVWTHHHLLLDGWSTSTVLREVFTAYGACCRGEEPAPAVGIPYERYIAWLQQQDLSRAAAFWRETLRGFTTPTPLMFDRSSSDEPGEGCGYMAEDLRISRETTEALRALARRHRVTLNTVVQGAWALLLSRYAGEEEVVFGATVSGRPSALEGAEEMVGLFINTLPVRVRVAPGAPLGAWLEEIQAQQVQAREYEYSPLVQVQGWSEVPRGRPLFESILVYDNYPVDEALRDRRVGGLEIQGERVVEEINYPLAVAVSAASELWIRIHYDAARFSAATIRRTLGHWQTVLESIAVRPERPLAQVSILTPAERELFVAWNDTAGEFPRHLCVQHLFEMQARRTPDALAVVWEGVSLTYRELDARANRLAHHLRRLGVGPEVPVGVCMERSADMVVGVLGILKAGGAYVPLDASWPRERLRQILAGLRVPVIVGRAAVLPLLRDLQWSLPTVRDLVLLDVAEPRPAMEPLDAASVRALWDSLAERSTDRVSAAGFVSSYTGEPFSEEEVNAYRDHVVSLALPHLAPGARVLEVGSGSGLVAFALAPRAGRYVALDPSGTTQARNREEAVRRGMDHLEFPTGFAHEIGAMQEGSFDVVILASTVQFFPGEQYLEVVVEEALRLLAPGGVVLLADVPDRRRAAELADEVRAARTVRGLGNAQMRTEAILSLDEGYFHDLGMGLGGISRVEVLRREGKFANELRFRYDVLLHRGRGRNRASEEVRTRRRWTAWHLEALPATIPEVPVVPENTAYIIHTSGSTGVPKGVVVRHLPVVNLIDLLNEQQRMGPEDRVLFITSLSFDLSVYDIFGLLAAGGTVHVASEADIRNPERLTNLLYHEPITFWDSAPAALQQLVPFFSSPEYRHRRSGLRLVFLSGDWIPVGLPDQVRDAFPGARVIALGGATETTVWSNQFPVEEVDPRWPSIPYGQPMRNARYYILDGELEPCPVGTAGDLFIGGECLADGYTRSVQTAERFVPDPYGAPGARMYWTGDRAHFWEDGTIEFLGRVDHQVKVRGFRIEVGEIEAALAHHPSVQTAVAVVREDEPGDRRLVAYFIPEEGTSLSPAELRSVVRESLPEYMIPSAFVEIASLPVTPNGKLDRAALPAPGVEASRSGAYVPPRGGTEEAVAEVWAEVLRVEQVGREDNFFDLGGHSLLLVQVHGKFQERLSREVPMTALFRYPTLGALAVYLDGGEDPGDELSLRTQEQADARRAAAQRRRGMRSGAGE